jgi:hypothetical protein
MATHKHVVVVRSWRLRFEWEDDRQPPARWLPVKVVHTLHERPEEAARWNERSWRCEKCGRLYRWRKRHSPRWGFLEAPGDESGSSLARSLPLKGETVD